MLDEHRDWEQEAEEDRRQTETFRRIHRLYKRGFRPDWTVTDVEDAIWWKHPGGYSDLILYPDGTLVACLQRAVLNPNQRHDTDRIHNTSAADVALFDKWLASVNPPTSWQAGAAARERYVLVPIFTIAFLGAMCLFGWGAEKGLRWLWHSIFG